MFTSATVDFNVKYLQYEFTKDCAAMISLIFNCRVNAYSVREKDKTYGGTSQSQSNESASFRTGHTIGAVGIATGYWLDDRGVGI
jgi:hypothetical protein